MKWYWMARARITPSILIDAIYESSTVRGQKTIVCKPNRQRQQTRMG